MLLVIFEKGSEKGSDLFVNVKNKKINQTCNYIHNKGKPLAMSSTPKKCKVDLLPEHL